MKKGYVRFPQFPGSLVENNGSKFRHSVKTPTSEEPFLTPCDSEDNFEAMNGANVPLIPGGSGFDEEDYLSEGNRQNYGLQSNEKSRRKKNGLCSRCWWFLCGGWREGCTRHVCKQSTIFFINIFPGVKCWLIDSDFTIAGTHMGYCF